MMASPTVELAELLACPVCHEPLRWRDDAFVCSRCATDYGVVDGIPLLYPPAARPISDANQLYDRIAGEYDRAIPAHVAAHYLRRRLHFVQRAMTTTAAAQVKVLDVCCGTGQMIAALGDAGYQAAGVDASLGMLRVLRQRQPRASIVAGHAQQLPFRDGVFDLVVSIAALHHIAEPTLVAAALAQMCRVARPGGKILVWDHNPSNPYWPRIMARVPQDSGEERLVPLAEVEQGLRASGCRRIESCRLGFTPDFVPRSALGVWRWLERLAETTPALRERAAHNVVLAVKDGGA